MGIPRFKFASNYLVALLTLERTHPFSVFNVVSASDGDIGDEDLRDAYAGAIIEAFEGRNPAVRAIAEQIIADRGHGFTDRVSAALMTDLGLDPIVPIAMAVVDADRVPINSASTDRVTVGINYKKGRRRVEVQVRLPDQHDWESDVGLVLMGKLPATIVAAAPGRLLKEIVSHPILDRFPLKVAKCEIEGIRTVLRPPAGELPRLTAAELIAVHPRSATDDELWTGRRLR